MPLSSNHLRTQLPKYLLWVKNFVRHTNSREPHDITISFSVPDVRLLALVYSRWYCQFKVKDKILKAQLFYIQSFWGRGILFFANAFHILSNSNGTWTTFQYNSLESMFLNKLRYTEEPKKFLTSYIFRCFLYLKV